LLSVRFDRKQRVRTTSAALSIENAARRVRDTFYYTYGGNLTPIRASGGTETGRRLAAVKISVETYRVSQARSSRRGCGFDYDAAQRPGHEIRKDVAVSAEKRL